MTRKPAKNPLGEELGRLGVKESDVHFYLRLVGADLHSPWAYRTINNGTTSGWKWVAKGTPPLDDVFRHLLHEKHVLSLPRFRHSDLIPTEYGTALIVDMDVNSPEQKQSLADRYACLDDILPYHHIQFISSEKGGRHRVIPLATFYARHIQEDDGSIVLEVERKGVTKVITGDGIEVFEAIKTEMKRIGFTFPADVEIWPQRKMPLRLPMGLGSYLITADGERIEDFAEAVAYLRQFVADYGAKFPFPEEILDHLQGMPARTLPWKPARSPRSQVAPAPTTGPIVVLTASSMAPDDMQDLLDHGLRGPGETNDSTMAIARHYLRRQWPCSAEQLSEAVWGWLEARHNGFASIYNSSTLTARDWVKSVCRNLVEKVERGEFEVYPPARPPLTMNPLTGEPESPCLRKGDLERLLQLSPIPRRNERRERMGAISRFKAGAALMQYAKNQVLAKRMSLDEAHQIPIPVTAIYDMAGMGRDQGKPSYYLKRLAYFTGVGLILKRSDFGHKRCRTFHIDHRFDLEGDIVDDIGAFIEGL